MASHRKINICVLKWLKGILDFTLKVTYFTEIHNLKKIYEYIYSFIAYAIIAIEYFLINIVAWTSNIKDI